MNVSLFVRQVQHKLANVNLWNCTLTHSLLGQIVGELGAGRWW